MTTNPTIPTGWKKIRVDKAFTFVPTASHSKDELTYNAGDSSVRNIHYGDIHAKYGDYVDLNDSEIPCLKKEDSNLERKLLKSGDLVMVDASEDLEGVGSCVEIMNTDSKKCIAGLHTFALRDSKNCTAIGYKSIMLKHSAVKNRMQQVSTYSKVYGISKKSFSEIELILPPPPEQNRIVAVLETWDKAIERLTQKIEVKKNVKKGLMHKLLTSQIRLPGFSEPWKKLILNNISKIYDGTHQTPNYVKSGIPFYSVEHITANDFTNTKFITEEVYKKDSVRVKIEEGDILMTRIGDIGTAKYIDWQVKASFYVTLALIKCFETVNSKFVTFQISSINFQRELWKKTIHVAFPNKINLGDIGKCELLLPPIAEQDAIASILTVADEEIETFERKLTFLENQKKFLLNNLVTGEIRVPE